MGIPEWRLRQRHAAAQEPLVAEPDQAGHVAAAPVETFHSEPSAQPLKSAIAADFTGLANWRDIESAVMACTACSRHSTRLHAVPGAGSVTAECLLVGEAPSAEDDATGNPFADASGVLLDNMLAAMGLNRASVYITQVIKCAAPAEQPPESSEILACSRYLEAQIKLLQPKLIVAFGLTAGRYLLNIKTDVSVGSLRGEVRQHAASGVPVIVTYHPRYLLKRPSAKSAAWQDLQQVMQHLKALHQ